MAFDQFSSVVNRPNFEKRKYSSQEMKIDPSSLVDLSHLMLERNSYFREGLAQLTSLYGNTTFFPQYKDNPVDDKLLLKMLLYFWVTTNLFNGVGQFGFSYPFAYQGMCVPSACSLEDIQNNSIQFGQDNLYVQDLGMVYTSPLADLGLVKIFQFYADAEDIIKQSVGCSDDQVYKGHWDEANYIIVSLLAVIGTFILVGTILDLYLHHHNNNKKSDINVGYQILLAFSLIENTKFVFAAPGKGESARFGCLEGMRSLSMTWVILGHHFLFAGSTLHVKNKEYTEDVQNRHGGGILFEGYLFRDMI